MASSSGPGSLKSFRKSSMVRMRPSSANTSPDAPLTTGAINSDWPELRLWLVIVADVGATGVGDPYIERDVVVVLAPVEASPVDHEVGFGNAVVADDHV